MQSAFPFLSSQSFNRQVIKFKLQPTSVWELFYGFIKLEAKYFDPSFALSYMLWIFTHLKLCLAFATHNIKWVKII